MDLFPALRPYSSGYLRVDDIHDLYWEQSGNPDGVPVVLLHGGPGAGAGPMHRRFFDPDHYRIIVFDQRGAGRSAPLGSIENNNAAELVGDIERLRTHLRVDRWHLFGGSWGSTLAMLYAIAHPERCISIVMRGIFLCEAEEIDWFIHGIHTVFPEAWEQFTAILNDQERDDILGAYYARLTHEDEDVQIEAAIHWSLYEGACSSLLPNYETITTSEQKQHALALARLEAHYFKHELIAPENSILTQIDRVRHIPCSIVQGRYDMICPIRTANRLHHAWPEADYVVVPDAGHSALDPALRSRLIEATEHAKALK
ncbi:MAG: prolyl aminopeptidase [Alphaproteobacteria bacterium]|nr:prolyl aminopeptidase [Alphaproteobacteria bacterium]